MERLTSYPLIGCHHLRGHTSAIRAEPVSAQRTVLRGIVLRTPQTDLTNAKTVETASSPATISGGMRVSIQERGGMCAKSAGCGSYNRITSSAIDAFIQGRDRISAPNVAQRLRSVSTLRGMQPYTPASDPASVQCADRGSQSEALCRGTLSSTPERSPIGVRSVDRDSRRKYLFGSTINGSTRMYNCRFGRSIWV